jgi:hypothetical protein
LNRSVARLCLLPAVVCVATFWIYGAVLCTMTCYVMDTPVGKSPHCTNRPDAAFRVGKSYLGYPDLWFIRPFDLWQKNQRSVSPVNIWPQGIASTRRLSLPKVA